ncbi:hypothetical protein DW193_20225 [Phocaeicola vulgatus]|uniref:Uncharacterized protein n=1 Tax=Phocaeicola vulgatus TaxID=821 RepID=A0A414XIY9_PHOVU|nr:hypothetical protein DW193_20225 [Phocaeicola vulgatus]
MKYPTKRLIIWRSLVQAQAGPQTKRLIPNGIQPFLFADPPDINLLLLVDLLGQRNNLRDFIFKHII